MNALAYAVIALLSLGLLLALGRRRSSAVETLPVGPQTPPPTPSGADRLDHKYWRDQLLTLPPSYRLVAICELHRDRLVDADTAIALIDEVA